MATYVNDLRLKEIGTGESSGTWGTETNVNLELIGEALGFGTEGITTNADTHTTTIADGSTDPGRAMYLKYTGTLDSACTITIAPNTISRMQFIENGTSGSQNIIISQGTGANVTIPAGDTKAIYLDGAGSGAAVVDAYASLNVVDLKVEDDLTVTDDLIVNGDIDLEGAIDVNGTANLDVVDIDGAVDMASTLTVAGVVDITDTTDSSDATGDTGALRTEGGASIAKKLYVGTDLDVDGTANLDIVDIDGAVDMASTLTVGGQVTFADGSAGAPSISNTGDVNAGLFFSAADVMSFSAGGTAQFTMADGSISPVTDNDIDLGTASLKYKSFFAALVDAENFKINGAQGSDGQVLTSTGSGVAFEDAAGGGPTFKVFGTGSIMVGDDATGTIDAANYNTGLGVDIFAALTTGDSNVAIGFDAADTLTTGSFNVAIGTDSLGAAGSGVANNIMIGYNTGSGLTGDGNVGIGHTAFDAAGDRDDCVAIGNGAATTLTTGSQNVAIGTSALGLGTTAHGNVCIGFLSASSLVGGSGGGRHNVSIGRESMEAQASQEDNIAIGYQALHAGNSTSNSQNTIVGSQAGTAAHAGYGNCYFGYTAGAANTSGIHNSYYGRQAGSVTTSGGNNLMLGYQAGTSSSPGHVVTGSNHIVLGNSSITNALIKVDWTVTSDSRDKTDVADLDLGLSFINSLAPKKYKWDMRSDYSDDLSVTPNGTYKKPQVVAGLLAQDVETLERAAGYKVEEQTNLVVSKDEKGNYGLQYAKLIPILIKALQEADDKIDALTARVTTLEG